MKRAGAPEIVALRLERHARGDQPGKPRKIVIQTLTHKVVVCRS